MALDTVKSDLTRAMKDLDKDGRTREALTRCAVARERYLNAEAIHRAQGGTPDPDRATLASKRF